VAALWARARITELENRRRRGADPDKTRKQIISTALAHKLVSKHTSLVAVDKTPSRPESMKLARESLANRVPHGQSAQALNGFAATATAAPAKRWAGLLLIAAALLLAAIGVRRERPCLV
jgi:Ca-activated chloride channel family protein